MKTDIENFDALLKLMALKKHETPPPGYFDRLPGKIVAQLGDRKEVKMRFLERIFSGAMLPPQMAYAAGLVFCALAAVGAYYSFKAQPATAASETVATLGYTSLASQQQTQSQEWSSTNEENQTIESPLLEPQGATPVLFKQPQN